MLRGSLISVFCSFCIVAFSQPAITGRVIEASTGQPLAGAQIALNYHYTLSDERGYFNLPASDTGKLVITYIGFNAAELTTPISSDSELIIALIPGVVQLADIVVTASNIYTPNKIATIDMQLRPTNSSQDLLRNVPGLFTAQHGGGGKAEQIFMRGFDVDHGTDIALSVDGLPVNMVSHAHGQGYADLHFVIPEIIAHADFDKGPYNAGKGNFATAGFVSFHTLDYLEKNFVKTEGGMFGTFRVVGAAKLRGKGQSNGGYIASELLSSDGVFDSPQQLKRLNFYSKYNFEISRKDDIALLSSFFSSGWYASGQIPDRSVRSGHITRFGSIDDTEGGNTRRYNLAIRHNREFSRGRYLKQQVYGIDYSFALFSNFTFFLYDSLQGDQIYQRESRNIFGYDARYSTQEVLFGRNIKSEYGGGFRYDDVNDIGLFNSTKRLVRTAKKFGNVNESNLFGYINGTLSLSDKWLINAALRVDHFNFMYDDFLEGRSQQYHKTLVSPKLNVTYSPMEKIAVYAKWGMGFHSNDTRVIGGGNVNDMVPQAMGVDIGMDAAINSNLFINAAVWRLDLSQEFIYVGDEGIVEAGGRTLRNGFDLSMRYQLDEHVLMDVDLNLSKPRQKDLPKDRNYIPLAPTKTSAGGITLRLSDAFRASLRYRTVAERPANEENTVRAEGYFLLDGVVTYVHDRLEFKATVENILNSEWKEAQFDTQSRLLNESMPVSEIHYTPGTPLFAKVSATVSF